MTLLSGFTDLLSLTKPVAQSAGAVTKVAAPEVKVAADTLVVTAAAAAKTAPSVSTKVALTGLVVGGVALTGNNGFLQQSCTTLLGAQACGWAADPLGINSLVDSLGAGASGVAHSLAGGLVCAGSTFIAWELSHNLAITAGVAACSGLVALKLTQQA
jgi:hypothetical protein